ncbi:MAG: hypothetical protein J5806_10860 [Lentisphaeria bacterium]|nr:hypothetical protein [Lentisphaeria bacterium]
MSQKSNILTHRIFHPFNQIYDPFFRNLAHFYPIRIIYSRQDNAVLQTDARRSGHSAGTQDRRDLQDVICSVCSAVLSAAEGWAALSESVVPTAGEGKNGIFFDSGLEKHKNGDKLPEHRTEKFAGVVQW